VFTESRSGKEFVNVDGVEQKREYASILQLAYSPDSQRLVVVAGSDNAAIRNRKTKYRYLVGDQEDPEFDPVSPMSWDSKGNRYYFGITYNYGVGGDTGHVTMLKNGQVTGEADVASFAVRYREPGAPVSTTSLAVADGLFDKLLGSTDAPKGLLMGRIGAFGMATDRNENVHFYGVRRDGKKCVVAWDGQDGAPVSCRWVYPSFNKDGTHLAYLANEGGEVVEWLDAKAGAAVSGVKDLVQGPVWSTGQEARIAYAFALKSNNLAVVVDHKVQREWPAQEITDVVFGPDGKSFAYRVEGQDGKQVVALNGQEGKRYDVVIPKSLRFDDHGALSYFAVDGLSLYRVTQKAN